MGVGNLLSRDQSNPRRKRHRAIVLVESPHRFERGILDDVRSVDSSFESRIDPELRHPQKLGAPLGEERSQCGGVVAAPASGVGISRVFVVRIRHFWPVLPFFVGA